MTMTNTWLAAQDPAKIEAALGRVRERSGLGAGTDYLDHAGGDEHFALWLAIADARAVRICGLGIFDIGDWTWADAYEDGWDPREAAIEALRADDTMGALFSE